MEVTSTSTGSPLAELTVGFHMVSSSSYAHGHQCDPLPHDGRTMETHMALNSSSDHGYQCGPRRQHDPWTSTRFQVAAQTSDIYLTFDGNRVMDISRVPVAVGTWTATSIRIVQSGSH